VKGSMGNPVASKAESMVLEKYPNFNFTMSDANYKWKQSSTNQRTINFVGGSLPRVSALVQQVNALPNVDLNVINKVMQAVSKQFGKTPYTDFESNRNAIVQEINTALSGSATQSDMRVKIELENLSSARSPQQIKGAINNLNEALIARMDVDLSDIYPIEVVRGEKSLSQYKNELFSKYRANFAPHKHVQEMTGNAGVSSGKDLYISANDIQTLSEGAISQRLQAGNIPVNEAKKQAALMKKAVDTLKQKGKVINDDTINRAMQLISEGK
jgi:hypothetical protein